MACQIAPDESWHRKYIGLHAAWVKARTEYAHWVDASTRFKLIDADQALLDHCMNGLKESTNEN